MVANTFETFSRLINFLQLILKINTIWTYKLISVKNKDLKLKQHLLLYHVCNMFKINNVKSYPFSVTNHSQILQKVCIISESQNKT